VSGTAGTGPHERDIGPLGRDIGPHGLVAGYHTLVGGYACCFYGPDDIVLELFQPPAPPARRSLTRSPPLNEDGRPLRLAVRRLVRLSLPTGLGLVAVLSRG